MCSPSALLKVNYLVIRCLYFVSVRGDLQEGHFYASRCHLPIFPSTESAFLCALPVAYLLQRRRPRHGRGCRSAWTAALKRQSCAGDYGLVPQRRSRCEGSAIGKMREDSIGKMRGASIGRRQSTAIGKMRGATIGKPQGTIGKMRGDTIGKQENT